MRKLLSQLRTRLILGTLAFLLALTGAMALVVRDSLQFLARNVEEMGVAKTLVENSLGDIMQATLLTIGYFAIMVIVGVVLASRALTAPIQKLVEGTRSIAAGDLSARIPVTSQDELGGLAESFNAMADSLQTRTQELMEANEKAIENARLYEQGRALAATEERQRLARELHDSVTQTLYSLTLLAEASRRTAQGGDMDKVVANIARLGETAQQALKEMRLLVYELRPMALEQTGLAEALQHRLDAVEKRAGVESQLHVDLNLELPADVENSLYRIAQEALNNSLKHAEATSVTVKLRTADGNVELEIADNGKGFEKESVDDKGGMGLGNIKERSEALGGQWSITSQPNEGTRVWIRVPVIKSN